jgi:hypothetical protein
VVTEYLSLPVPRSPMTCQMSVISAQDFEKIGVRMTGLPSRCNSCMPFSA